MVKVGIAGFGKIGRLRAQKILEKNYAQVVAIYDVKKPSDLSSDIIFVIVLMSCCHRISMLFLYAPL
ncbi:glyceraldehyde 3-phosphate dehydrogenase NAD-binding domain-containing protein [Helicobacter pullorum]|uniref:glyceraldehyde 3-phosphate dehydrogenase NAD-binding domain-containing protein n=1 Tax=Helicobacter pullorum TaxID=35818 RepID=UPI00243187D1|nr:glyceraldehyde 3-phosphate dehydrogenase NAD-binding domain-containing protein [Helicobacter pullorum]